MFRLRVVCRGVRVCTDVRRFTSSTNSPSQSSNSSSASSSTSKSTTKSAATSDEPMSLFELATESPVVQNVAGGSIARDMLALERTYLAWLRTCLATAGLSVPLHEIVRTSESPLMQLAAPSALCFSTILLGFSTWRYFNNCRLLLRGQFHYNRRGVLSLSIIGMVFSGTLLAAFVASGRESLLPRVFANYDDVHKGDDEDC